MKLTLLKRRDPSERDDLVVMIAVGDDTPENGRKVTFSCGVGKTIDLQKVVDEQGLDVSAEELGYAVLGDKRFKGLFKMVAEVHAKPAVITKKKVSAADDEDDDIKPNAKKAPPKKKPLAKNKSVTAGSYQDKSVEAV